MRATVITAGRHALPAVVLLGAFAVAACSPVGSSPASTTAPAPASAPAPSSVAVPTSVANPSNRVVLASATGDVITVDVSDASGTLVEAVSGVPGDGASVEPYQLAVTNDDPTTLRLTWAGGPCDAADTLSIDESGHSFLLVEPECPGDAVAYDRVLILTFSAPIAATEVRASLQDGLDTSG